MNNQTKGRFFCLIVYMLTILHGYSQDIDFNSYKEAFRDTVIERNFEPHKLDSIITKDCFHSNHLDFNITPIIRIRPYHSIFCNPYNINYNTSKRSINIDFDAHSYYYPGLLSINNFSSSITLNHSIIDAYLEFNLNKYYFRDIENQFGISTQIGIDISKSFRLSAFADFYTINPYYSIASYPYVKSSRYGGYVSYNSSNFGINLGVERKYDPFMRQWYTTPIVTPIIKISKVQIGLPVGELLRAIIYDMSRKKKR